MKYTNYTVSILESREGAILLSKSFEHEGEQHLLIPAHEYKTFFDAMIAAEQLELKLRDKGLVDNFNLSIDLRSPTNREAEETSTYQRDKTNTPKEIELAKIKNLLGA